MAWWSAPCETCRRTAGYALMQKTENLPFTFKLQTAGNVDARDGAVISYLHKLQEHRKACVDAGRYEEAQVTAERLASLRTQQVERLRQVGWGVGIPCARTGSGKAETGGCQCEVKVLLRVWC